MHLEEFCIKMHLTHYILLFLFTFANGGDILSQIASVANEATSLKGVKLHEITSAAGGGISHKTSEDVHVFEIATSEIPGDRSKITTGVHNGFKILTSIPGMLSSKIVFLHVSISSLFPYFSFLFYTLLCLRFCLCGVDFISCSDSWRL